MAKIQLFKFLTDKTGANKFTSLVSYWIEEDGRIEVWFEHAEIPAFNKILASDPAQNYSHNPNIGKLADYKFCESTILVEFRGILNFPYAERLETPDSPFCAAGGCDLRIAKIEVTPESLAGLQDGVARITATGSYGGKEYSVNNDNSELEWQASSTFGGLAPGTYNANVRDANSCLAIQPFAVPAGRPLAYGLRFLLSFSDPQNRKCSLRVTKRFFDSVPEKVCGSAQPVVPDYAFESGQRFKHIVGSQMRFTLQAEYENQFIEFFTFDEREFRAELWDDEQSVLIWAGFVLPDTYSESWTKVPKMITIIATDGLGTLKDRAFADNVGNPYVGELTAWQVIRLCLKPLQLRLPYRESISWYEKSMDQTGEVSPLSQLSADVAQYYGDDGKPDSCEQVLVKILSAFQAQIFQENGYWVITQPNWIAYKEGPQDPPPVPVWPAVSFELLNPSIKIDGFNIFGQVNIISLTGGAPADGAFEYSLNEQTWQPVTTLEVSLNGYLLKPLAVGGSGIVYVRRANKPQNVAQRPFTIPSLAADSVTVKAVFNVSTGKGSITVTRQETSYPVKINYETWQVDELGNNVSKVATGSLEIAAGIQIALLLPIDGTYSFVNRYDLQIVSTEPALSYQSRTRMSPTGGFDFFGK